MLSVITNALDSLRDGRMVILVDGEDRENEGDLVMAAEFVTSEAINFMAGQGRGLICLALGGAEADRLGLVPMVAQNNARWKSPFTVSIEARTGITTGISAHDRAHTIRIAADPASGRGDIVSPGHVFPLRASEGGVLVREGHTEGSVDLMRIAGLGQAAVICEIMNDDGSMARLPDLKALARRHDLPIVTIKDLIAHRLTHEVLIETVAVSRLPSAYADTPLELHAFRNLIDGSEHIALVKAPLLEPALVRVHSGCLTGDVLGSLRCDCGAQLQAAMRHIAESPSGILIYMREHEGRGIGLANKIRAYALQDQGLDTFEANEALGFAADLRTYGMAAQILRHLGVERLRLLSNSPRKREALTGYGLKVVEQVPLIIDPNPHNLAYLRAKQYKTGHSLNIPHDRTAV